MEHDGITLVYYDLDEEEMHFQHYESVAELLEEIEDEEDFNPETCMVFRGHLDPLVLRRKLTLVEVEAVEEEDEEEVTSEQVEEKLRTRFSPPDEMTF